MNQHVQVHIRGAQEYLPGKNRELIHEPLHLFHGQGNAREGVRPEPGVFELPFDVPQNEGEHGHEVLEIVDHEGRKGVERLRLLRANQGLNQLHVQKTARRLRCDRLDQGIIFVIHDISRTALRQPEDSDELRSQQQRDNFYDPGRL